MNQDSLNKLINMSWIDFKNIEQITITIQGHYDKQLITRKSLKDYQKKFLLKNNELYNYFDIEWLTTNSKASHLVELTIKIISINN